MSEAPTPLLPCPCGSNAIMEVGWKSFGHWLHSVMCNDCGHESAREVTITASRATWNREARPIAGTVSERRAESADGITAGQRAADTTAQMNKSSAATKIEARVADSPEVGVKGGAATLGFAGDPAGSK